VGLTKELDRIPRQCLWRDKEGEPKQSLAAWNMICKPKLKGGLGIVDFQKQNAALLIKFLDKFYNKQDLPWVNLVWDAYYQEKVPHAENICGSFWWKDVIKQVDNSRGVAKVQHGRGDTLLFWSDNWEIENSSQPMCRRFPRLYSFVINENCSVVQVYQSQEMENFFS
jgi:hypothetical protein